MHNVTNMTELSEFCETLYSTPDADEVMEHINNEDTDFEVDGVRFIHTDAIDDVLAEELASDAYVLGSFNASFLAGVTGWPEFLIKLANREGIFNEELGQQLIDGGFVKEIAEQYAQADGYGHHFNHYDFSETELEINGTMYHVFDNQ